MKCETCSKPAAVHLTEVKAGRPVERHLCGECVVKDGIHNRVNLNNDGFQFNDSQYVHSTRA